MFLSSQLVEISQHFQPDIEDLQVLLQEEGLPAHSAESLPQLSARLKSDPRFRRDVAFLVRSMLYREPDEPGSMDVLGILVVAAAGTRQTFETGSQQEVLRELLRFVMQQRRPLPPATEPAVIASPPPIQTKWAEPIRPAPAILEPAVARVLAAQVPAALPSLDYSEPESFWRRGQAMWVFALLALLVGLGAGLILRRPEARTPGDKTLAVASPAAAPKSFPVEQSAQAIASPTPLSLHKDRRSSPRRKLPPPARSISRRFAPAQSAAPVIVAANAPSKLEMPKSEIKPDSGPKPAPLVNPNPVQPQTAHRDSAVATPASDLSRQHGGARNPFAHPEAATAAAASQPSPTFRPNDPVLIARNAPPNPAAPTARPQVTVHTGLGGPMASSLMYSPEPDYPSNAIAAGVQGEVKVRAVVGPNGNVIDAHVVSGPPLLRDAALQAVGRWRFRPYEEDGRSQTVATTAILDFLIPAKQ